MDNWNYKSSAWFSSFIYQTGSAGSTFSSAQPAGPTIHIEVEAYEHLYYTRDFEKESFTFPPLLSRVSFTSEQRWTGIALP